MENAIYKWMICGVPHLWKPPCVWSKCQVGRAEMAMAEADLAEAVTDAAPKAEDQTEGGGSLPLLHWEDYRL